MYREIQKEELRTTVDTGYQYFIDKQHPLASGNSYRVYYHRHILSLKVGYWISSKEHVHHIDGNKLNNNIDNLLLISNSEHAKLHKVTTCTEVVCKYCNNSFIQRHSTQQYCSIICANKDATKLNSLTKEQLEYFIWTQSFTQLALKFNCSDNGIRKWAQRLGCIMPPSRFHSKKISLEQRILMYNAALAQSVEH